METQEIAKTVTSAQMKNPSIKNDSPHIRPVQYVLCIGDCPELIRMPPCSGMRLFFINYYADNPILNSLSGLGQKDKSHPDAVILSGNIGKENIQTLLNKIQADAYLKQIPVLLCCIATSDFTGFKKSFPCLDDAVSMERFTSKELLRKILFLKKIKGTNTFSFSVQQERAPVMHRFLYNFDLVTRRILDIVIAALALCILSPVMLLIALLIKIESKGPVFYSAYRAGRAYRIFKFYKFRSMVYGADSRRDELKYKNQYADITKQGPVFFKVANDPRITRFGAFLRKTSLDELPQLINVLKGDMALVGNRPLPLYEAATLTSDNCAERFLAPAGITGLWQVEKRGNSEMSASERIGLDITYAHNHSFWYDLKIICKTPFSMTQKEKV